MDVNGKVAIVTGGGTGIGKAISRALAEGGASVAVNYSRSEAEANETAEEITQTGGQAIAVQADVSRAGDIHAMVERVVRDLGRVDILVNNAGFTKFVPMRDLDNMDEESWDRIFDVNVKGTWLCSRAVAEPMRQLGGGAIVNIASVASSLIGVPNRFVYGASKAALLGLTKSVAVDFVKDGVRVNAICPGTVDSPSLHERLRATGDYEGAMASFIARQPMGRIAQAEEIALMAVYLASDGAAFVTGQAFVIDGGWTAA